DSCMKRIMSLVFYAFLICVTTTHAQGQEPTPFHIWNHKLAVSLDEVKRFGVMQDSLMIRYKDDSTLSISQIDIASLPVQSHKTASEILAAVYGKQIPQDEALKAAHANNLKDAIEHEAY